MECRFCRGKIHPVRRLWDRDFCCRAHRVVFQRAKFKDGIIYSARLIREMEGPEFGFAEDEEAKKKHQKALPLPVVLCVMLGFVLLFLALPRSGPVTVGGATGYVLDRNPGWFPGLRQLWTGAPSVTLKESFHSGLRDWRPADWKSLSNTASDWAYRAGSVRPGRLRLWAPSLELTDYSFGFEAEIEKKGLGWAFRASNHENYYGARVEISEPGANAITNVVHYAMVGGLERDRVELPLPVGIVRGEQYRISMRIRGSKFVTSINGQVVDIWSDQRLRAGGVGFFTEKGDVASIYSVNVSTERSLWDRLFSSFILLPPVSMWAD